MKPNHYILFLILIISISACKKDSNGSTAPISKTKKDYLTQKEWVSVAERENTDNGAWTDTYSTYKACEKDNRISFSANGICIASEGATKCSASDPQTAQGTWAFTINDTKLSISGIGGQQDYTILQLDDNTLKLLQETTFLGHIYKSEGTWGHP